MARLRAPRPQRPPPPQRANGHTAGGTGGYSTVDLAGRWLWTCRTSYEEDLVEEIRTVSSKLQAGRLEAGLVASNGRPRKGGTIVELAFARQGFPVEEVVTGDSVAALAAAAARRSRAALAGPFAFAVHVFTSDSESGSRLAPRAANVEKAVLAELLSDDSWRERCMHAADTRLGKDRLFHMCLLDDRHAAVGTLPMSQAVSLAPGGIHRIGAPSSSPSRAAAKLLEAFSWLGRAPEPGDRCIDLGAAPGGWVSVLLARRARVLAVDPARLAPALLRSRDLFHARQSAFQFTPDEPVDWLLCDMAWRPLEVAALLAKWGRRRWARFLIANIKLPMRRKVDMIRRVREILDSGGWRDLRVRQLYHDRDEVTLGAWHLG